MSNQIEEKPTNVNNSDMSDSDLLIEAETQSGKRPRRAVGAHAPLKAAKRTGYKRRWVNDYPGNVREFLEAGYTFVRDPNANLSTTGKTGGLKEGAVTAVINRSIPDALTHRAYLMEIREDWYKEDQIEKHNKNVDYKTTYDPSFAHKKGVIPSSTEFDVYNSKFSPTKS